MTYLTDGVDVDVVFGTLRVRDKRLDEELTEDTRDSLDLNVLARTSLDPFFSLRPGLVEAEQATLASPLDQLVWFGNELGTGSEQPRVDDLCLVEDILDSGVFGEIDGGESGRSIVGGRGRERRRFDDGGTSEVVVEDGLAISLEDRFGRHIVESSGEGLLQEGRLREGDG